MEPGDRAAQALTPDPAPAAARTRLRLAAACLLLTGLAMVQSPGKLVPDTKLDLAIAPDRFLERALHLWDPLGAGGQLQNQAYGYLWPMGPFFWVGHLLDVPDWAVQRLWLALVLCTAFLGAALLARALGVRSDIAIVAGGAAYALSPRMLTTLGPISIEAWPSALAPWVLLPLVIGSTRGSPRLAAALAALAVTMVGGVNAAATFAVLPLGVLWLLTRTPGPRRRTMLIWWPLLTGVGTLWWLVPLFTLGAYSPPFLDFIESSAATTFPTTLFDALRGTSNWVPYIEPASRAGNDLLRLSFLAVDSGVLLVLGLAGIAWRGNPHRLFLAAGVLTGLAMVTLGHLGAVQGWFAPQLHDLLDGVLAPLRNVHKFDPIIRLPLVLGLAWAVDRLLALLGSVSPELPRQDAVALRVRLWAALTVSAVALAGAALPAWTGRIAPAGEFESIPGYWVEAADYLARNSGDNQTLLVPGSSFGTYVWGSPRDEPMQALARSRWAVRNAVPLTPPGNIRALDAIESRLSQGRGSAGLSDYLRRAGIEYLLVRNDLTRTRDVPDPVLVHQALDSSPGIARVATFGPTIGGEPVLEAEEGRILVNGGWQTQYPALEIYRVVGRRPALAAQATAPPTVVGGPEDLLDLADLGLLDEAPAVLATDVTSHEPDRALVLTDGLRAVERNFGRVHDGASATREPGEVRRVGNRLADYLPEGAERWLTTARIEGVAGVSASSSMSDADAFGGTRPGQLPYAAFDGDRATLWRANYDGDLPGAWWEVRLSRPRSVTTLSVTAGPENDETIEVVTDDVRSEAVSVRAGSTRTVRVADSATSTLKIQDASGRPGHRMGLAEVAIPGLRARRWLDLPTVPATWGNPSAIVLRSLRDARRGCARVSGHVRCLSERVLAGEEGNAMRRTLTLSAAGRYLPRLRVALRPGAALAESVFRQQPVNVAASSHGVTDPRGSILAAVDDDVATSWSAATSDIQPRLSVDFVVPRTITGLRLFAARSSAVRLPRRLLVSWPGGSREVTVDRSGEVRLPGVRTRSLGIKVLAAEEASSLDFASNPSPVPVGITELRVLGAPELPIAVPTREQRYDCGTGPTMSINGNLVRTAVTAAPADLYAGAVVEAEPCGVEELTLRAGLNRVEVGDSGLFAIRSVVLTSAGKGASGTLVPGEEPERLLAGSSRVAAKLDGPGRRTIEPMRDRGVVVLRENTNPGWLASQGSEELDPVLVDGWQQGWRLAGDGPVRQTFGPDAVYRWGLLGGLAAALLLALGCLWAALRRGRRRTPEEQQAPALSARALPSVVTAGLGVLAGGVLAGWIGAAVALVAVVVTWFGEQRIRGAGAALALLVMPAALAYSLRPWGSEDGWAGTLAWPHYLVLAACVSVLVEGGRRRPRRRTARSRIAGSSTVR